MVITMNGRWMFDDIEYFSDEWREKWELLIEQHLVSSIFKKVDAKKSRKQKENRWKVE